MVVKAFQSIGLEDDDTMDILRKLAGILLLGNVSFHVENATTSIGDSVCRVAYSSKETIAAVSKMFDVDETRLDEWLTYRQIGDIRYVLSIRKEIPWHFF